MVEDKFTSSIDDYASFLGYSKFGTESRPYIVAENYQDNFLDSAIYKNLAKRTEKTFSKMNQKAKQFIVAKLEFRLRQLDTVKHDLQRMEFNSKFFNWYSLITSNIEYAISLITDATSIYNINQKQLILLLKINILPSLLWK